VQPGSRSEAFYSSREFVEREWMPRMLPTLKVSTQSSYRTNLNRYVLPWLGGTRLRDLRKGDIQAWLSALSESGLSRQTVKNIWSALSSVLRTALDWSYINENPAHGVRLPARQPKVAVFLPTPEQVAQILRQLPEPSYTLLLLLVGTGLRVGEAMGLRWEDIDLNRKNLTVRRDVWHGQVNSPKYAASERVIPLGPILAEHLQRRLSAAGSWIFSGNSGKPLDPRNLAKRQLHPVLDSLGIPRFSWHRLRKLHSTYLGDLSVSPRILQAQLGHADAALTLNVYTQVVPESQRRAIENLEGLLFRNVPKAESGTTIQWELRLQALKLWRARGDLNARPLVPENMGLFWRVLKILDFTIFLNQIQRPGFDSFGLDLIGYEPKTITFLSHPTFPALFTRRVKEIHLYD
jgi:integrase